ncbi:MAG: LysM peptidoglycan-binding domain-containing protein [Lentisphaerae bacterium]|nr:LysM peptidoglycan-binding domain-containing protein [Lentisphaerota bacterium]
MRSGDLDSFKEPSRRPWILVAVLLAAGAAVYWYRQRPQRPPVPAETRETSAPAAISASSPAPRQAPPPPAPAAPAKPESSGRLLDQGRAHEAAGNLPEARRCYLAALAAGAAGNAAEIERRLGKVNVELISGPHAMPEKVTHTVQRGESLDAIAGRYGTTSELIQKGNGIANANMIRMGQSLRVLSGKFELGVSRARNDMLVTLNGAFFKRYPIGSGKDGKTPVGTFQIVDKEKNPTWWPEGREVPFGHPDNILGTRWMSLRATGGTADARGYGIHGTWDDASIGKSESAGCVRMRNGDVEELFTFVPRGTPVVIKD